VSSVPFHYVDLRAFAYATEDEALVERALRTLVPEATEFDRAESRGHHGDRIVVLSTRLERADEIRHVLGRLAEGSVAATVRAELDERIDDDCALFCRLDKAAALNGEVRLGRGITLRAKVEAYPAERSAAVENAREALDALSD
jgi:hypothetical protein